MNPATVINTIRGSNCNNVVRKVCYKESTYTATIALPQEIDGDKKVNFSEGVEHMLNVHKFHMEDDGSHLKVHFLGKGTTERKKFVLIEIEMLLENDKFRGGAKIFSNSQELVEAITLLLPEVGVQDDPQPQ